MQFGTTKTTMVLNDNGSTATEIENVFNGNVVRPVRKMYEIKTRVTCQQQELEAYLAFSDENMRDRTRLDPYFRIDRTKAGNDNGYYYVTSCYTTLVY